MTCTSTRHRYDWRLNPQSDHLTNTKYCPNAWGHLYPLLEEWTRHEVEWPSEWLRRHSLQAMTATLQRDGQNDTRKSDREEHE